jgi:hypothetical protein
MTQTHGPYFEGRRDLVTVGKFLPDYTALQPRRQPSSYSPLWEPQVLLNDVLVFVMLADVLSSIDFVDSLFYRPVCCSTFGRMAQ